MIESNVSDRRKSIESINAAKRRLIELEAVEKTAKELEEKAEREAHFVDRRSKFLIAGGIIIVSLSIGKLFYHLFSNTPLDTLGFFSMLNGIVVAAVLVWRLDGWRRAKRNERRLHTLSQKIQKERADIGKFVD